MTKDFDANIQGKIPVHLWMIPVIKGCAKTHGYAIAVHGSLGRDLDLVAIPWTEEASTAEVLVEHIKQWIGGTDNPSHPDKAGPELKPHGRRAWEIHFQFFYIDLSVMPLLAVKG